MTTEQFYQEANRIAESFLSVPSIPMSEVILKNAIQQLIYRFYESGGHIFDNFDQPIRDFEDVEVVVNRGAYTMSVSTIRRYKTPDSRQRGEREMKEDRHGNHAMLAKMNPNEPFFVLRGQDAFSAELVRRWADLAESAGAPPAKVANARECARAMRNWPKKKIPD